MEEIWKDIKGYEGLYAVSNQGRVYSYLSNRYLSQEITNSRYLRVSLQTADCRTKHELVHRLVAIAFLDNPDKLPQVNHKDHNRENNCVDNLEWCSVRDNNAHSGCWDAAAKVLSKEVEQLTMNGEYIKTWPSCAEAERALGIKHIYRAANGTRQSCGGFRWNYVIIGG